MSLYPKKMGRNKEKKQMKNRLNIDKVHQNHSKR